MSVAQKIVQQAFSSLDMVLRRSSRPGGGRAMASGSHSIIFSTGEPAYAVDGDGVIAAWNSAASAAFGYSSDEAVGQKCWELLQGKDTFGNQYCHERCSLLDMAMHHKSVNRCKMCFKKSDEEWQWFKVSTLVLLDEPGGEMLIHMCRPESGSAMYKSTPAHTMAGLTKRESQALHLLSEGHATGEIATLMGITVPTVRNHIEHILNKLHVHSRIEAVATGRRLGLL
jgi:PAS domain S-box-containing protein